MQSKLKYIKKFISAMIWPVLLELGQFLLIIIFTIFFNYKYLELFKNDYPNLSDVELLNKYLTNNSLLMIIILFIVMFPILFYRYKNLIGQELAMSLKKVINIILVSILIALFSNTIIYSFNNICHFTNRYDGYMLTMSVILTTGILSPILEEYIFRGLLFNKLKSFNSTKTAIILTTLIFVILHFELSQMFYTTIIGVYLIYTYIKYHNIFASILAHITINTSTFLLLPIIITYNTVILIALVFLICLFLIFKNMRL